MLLSEVSSVTDPKVILKTLKAYEFWVENQVAVLEARTQELREGLLRGRALCDRRI